MPLPFQEVQTSWEQARSSDSFFKDMTLQQYSQFMNKHSGTDDYSAGDTGAVGSFFKNVNVGINDSLKPVSDVTGNVGEALGGLIGPTAAKVGRSVGEGLPRQAVGMGTMALGAVIPPAAPVLEPLGMGMLAGDAALQTFEHTGSPLAAGASAATMALLPGAGRLGEAAVTPVANSLGIKAAEAVGDTLGGLINSGVKGVGEVAGMAAAGEVGGQASSLAAGQGLQPWDAEHLGHTIGGLVPFLPFNIVKGVKGVGEFKGEMQMGRDMVESMGRLDDTVQRQNSTMKSMETAAAADAYMQQFLPKDLQFEPTQRPPNLVQPLDVQAKAKANEPSWNAPLLPGEKAQSVPVATPAPVVPPKVTTQTSGPQVFESVLTPGGKVDQFGLPFDGTTKREVVVNPDGSKIVREGGMETVIPAPAKPKGPQPLGSPDVVPKGSLPSGKGKFADTTKPMKSEVLEPLAELEADGATAEQVVRAFYAKMAELQKPTTPLSPTGEVRMESVRRMLARKATPDELLRTTQQVLTRIFQMRGETPEDVNTKVRQALRVVARFPGLEHITMVHASADRGQTPANFSVPPMPESARAFIAILSHQNMGRSKGVNPYALEDFQTNVVTGHELAHQHGFSVPGYENANQAHWVRAYEQARKLSPVEQGQAYEAAYLAMVPAHFRSKDMGAYLEMRKAVYGQGGKEGITEFMADMTGLLAAGSSHPSLSDGISDLFRFGNHETQAFAKGVVRDLASIWGAVKSFVRGEGFDTTTVERTDNMVAHLRKVLRSAYEADQIVNTFLGFSDRATARAFDGFTVASFDEISAGWHKYGGSKPSEIPKDPDWVKQAADVVVPYKDSSGLKLSVWDKYIPIGQLVNKFPILRPVFDLGMRYRAMVSSVTQNLWKPFANEKGKLDKTLIKAVGKEGTVMNKVFNEIALHQQVEQRTLWDHEELKQMFPSYATMNEKGQTQIRDALMKFGQTASTAAVLRIRAHREDVEGAMSRILQSGDRQMKADEAVALGKEAVKVAWDEATDPEGAHQANLNLLAKVQPALIDKVVEAAKANISSRDSLTKQLMGEDGKGKLWYFPEVRLGQFVLSWKPVDGEKQTWSFKTKQEFQAKDRELQQLQAQGKLEYLRGFDKFDRSERFKGLNRDMIAEYQAADKLLYDSVLKAVGESGDQDTIDKIRAEFQPGDGVARVSTSPYMQERQLVGGRDRLNMAEGMIHYIDATSHGLAKRWVKTRQATILNEPELRSNPNIQNAARTYLTNVTDAPAAELTTMKNLVFWNYMGMNPSSLPIELSQQFLTLSPYLVSKGAGMGQSYKIMAGAWKDVVSNYKNGKYADQELDAHVKRAKLDQVIDAGVMQDLQATGDVDFINSRQLLSGDGHLSDVKDVVRSSMYHVLKLARDFYGLATTFNSESAFVSSYKYAREHMEMGEEAAHTFAVDATRSTMFGGGVNNRPLALYGLGKAQGVGGLMYSLQGYTFNMLSMMAHLTKKSIADSSLAPAEKLAARKAAGMMFGVQATLGGVMGLPMVGAVSALIDQVFPEAQIKKHLRETFFNLVGDDNANLGHIVADGAMNGLFNTPLGMGADVGARFQLGNMLGVSAYDGFSWKNLVGPAGSMVENYVKGGEAVARGEVGKAVESASPAGLRGLVKMLNDSGAMHDGQERMMFEPTVAEQAMMAGGLKPKRYNQYLERQALLAQAEKVAQRDSNDFHQQVADALQTGDTKAVQQLLYTRQIQEPGYDVQSGIKKAAQIVQGRVTPHDPREDGSLQNSTSLAAIQRLYPQGQGPSEVSKLQSQQALLQASGIPVRPPHASEYARAAMIDKVMEQNPHLLRTQASAIVDRVTGGGASSYQKYGATGPVPSWQGF